MARRTIRVDVEILKVPTEHGSLLWGAKGHPTRLWTHMSIENTEAELFGIFERGGKYCGLARRRELVGVEEESDEGCLCPEVRTLESRW